MGAGAVGPRHPTWSGWIIASPTTPLSERSNTWLLLRMTGLGTPVFVQRLPRVPMQQNLAPVSFTFPPEVPSFMGGVWAVEVSLGKICDGVGVGVGAGVLEPPQPARPINKLHAKRKPKTFAINFSLFIMTAWRWPEERLTKFYAGMVRFDRGAERP